MAAIGQVLQQKIDNHRIKYFKARHEELELELQATQEAADELYADNINKDKEIARLRIENFKIRDAIVPKHTSVPESKKIEPSPLMRKLIDKFLAYEATESTNTERTLQARMRHLNRFIDIIGYDLSISDLSASHIQEYREVMHHIPSNFDKLGYMLPTDRSLRAKWFSDQTKSLDGSRLSGGGINSAFKHARQLLRWAKTNRYLPEDYSDMLTVSAKREKSTRKKRVPFTQDQLNQLFTGYLYGDRMRPREKPLDWKFWVPLIALTTGMRSDEIGALTLDSLIYEQGFWCIRIGEAKSDAGIRYFPIPESLINAGLIEYYKDKKSRRRTKSKPTRLFEELKLKGKTSKYSDTIGQFFNASSKQIDNKGEVRLNGYMARVGVFPDRSDISLSFHSLRHNFVTLMLNTKLKETGEPATLETIKNIVGHSMDFAKTYGISESRWSDVTLHTYNHRDRLPIPEQKERLHAMKQALDNLDFGFDLNAVSFSRFKCRKKK
ncbi:hypothetical protein VIN01S_00920 [Vibrio inusitatus NBRC 102082]|uniref:Tyr recombinase domain-containing protein n=2 Tax=Vibrio inusitatus TaxID=413402 RepID=A0A4Y3HQH7_9VIBR|nr:hypothetical protein VIN01S_00920 [Vibrio inusitatus NBRC 102082]